MSSIVSAAEIPLAADVTQDYISKKFPSAPSVAVHTTIEGLLDAFNRYESIQLRQIHGVLL
jgi:hypothetical protein